MKHPLARLTRMPTRVFNSLMVMALVLSICIPYQLATPEIAHADTTGTTSPSITIFYGTGDTVSGQWQEDILTVDGKMAYCVEVDSDFKSGLNVSPCDPVAKGIWSQEICTKLALIDQFVRSGEYVSTSKGTGTGKKVTNSSQQYAVAQCYIWKFLNDAGYSSNHYGWFGASMSSGVDLTGSDTDQQIWDYVNDNLDAYVGSAKYYDCGSSQNVACEFSLTPAKGWISLNKKSSDESLTKDNGEYSLQGAKYSIFSDKNCSAGSLVAEMSTDEKGEAKSKLLARGTYYIKEASASKGFKTDSNIYPVTVEPGSGSVVNASVGSVPEKPNSGAIELKKKSSNATISNENSCYTLEGALYGIYSDSSCETLIAKMTTNKEGVATSENIPLGMKYVREISPPQGYAIDETVYEAIVTGGKTIEINGGYVDDIPKSCPIQVLVQKYDEQKDSEEQPTAQGSASLANAEFEIAHYAGYFDTPEEAEQSGSLKRTWIFKTDESGTISLDEDHLVSGDVLLKSSDGTPCMPLGTLVIKETVPPRGYIASNEAVSVQITDDGSSEEYVETYKQPFVPNKVSRGDFEFVKYSEEESNTLSGIPFAITSLTTGETHVLVTGEGGRASTSSSWNPHTQNTNGNDWTLDSAFEKSEENDVPDDDANENNWEEQTLIGEIRGVISNNIADASNSGSDTETEEDAEPNEKMQPDGTGSTSENDATDLMALNEGANNSSESVEDKENNADSEKEGQLLDATTSDDPGGKEEASEDPDSPFDQAAGIWFGYGSDGACSIEADDSVGSLPYDTYLIQELPCEANKGLQLVNASVVISKDSEIIDLGSINDPVATIGTTASDSFDSDKTIPLGYVVEIVDQVDYANLIPNNAYTIIGTLMNAETGKAVVDESGNAVTASESFIPENSEGSIQLSFTLSTEDLADVSLVAFEKLECEGRVIATHEDINDEGQTVRVSKPAIGTSATNSIGDSQTISADLRTTVKDSVSFCNLIPGCEYTLESSLMDASNEEPFTIDGKAITSITTFTPEEANGTIEVSFDFDSSEIKESTSLVAFEKITNAKGLVATHEDINDQGQTVTIVPPNVQTSLMEAESDKKTISPHPDTILIDTISYTGLAPGREYKVVGTLMDKESGKSLLDNDGNPIESITEFAPESSQGSVEVEFAVDGSLLAGKQVVAFEALYLEEKEIAIHADINDDSQTVVFSQPSIKTLASDKADQDKIVIQDEQSLIVDSVSLSGITPSREYTVIGLLMDKSTNLPLIQGGKSQADQNASPSVSKAELEAFWLEFLEATGMSNWKGSQPSVLETGNLPKFNEEALAKVMERHPDIASRIVLQSQPITPTEESFTMDMEFSFSSLGIAGQTVVFETLVDKQTSTIIAQHADMSDDYQTVEIVPETADYPPSESRALNTGKGSLYDKTGNLIAQYAWLIALLAAFGSATGAIAVTQHKTKRKQDALRHASLFDSTRR